MRDRKKPWRFRAILAVPLLLLLPLVLGGCASALNALISDDGYEKLADRPYGPNERQKLDVYLPKAGGASSSALRPVVVFIYGGNWQGGDKDTYPFVGEALTSLGYIAVIPDYRVYPEVRFPGFLEDSAAATAWVLDNIAALGGDPNRVHLMGHSAGAYNAAMLAFDSRWLGERRPRIRSFVGLAGPYDFLPLTDPDLKIIFGTGPDLAATQPINFVDGTAPPVFVAHGLDDTMVRPRNSQRLAEKVRETGGRVTERYYENRGHIALVTSLAAPLRNRAPVLEDVSVFLRTQD